MKENKKKKEKIKVESAQSETESTEKSRRNCFFSTNGTIG